MDNVYVHLKRNANSLPDDLGVYANGWEAEAEAEASNQPFAGTRLLPYYVQVSLFHVPDTRAARGEQLRPMPVPPVDVQRVVEKTTFSAARGIIADAMDLAYEGYRNGDLIDDEMIIEVAAGLARVWGDRICADLQPKSTQEDSQ